uniref:BHLH domain-containing protein n=1 Tax=Kalanchoe fedtschenkoi TaxID=63787 RepID=A0A7N0VED9_KALFE
MEHLPSAGGWISEMGIDEDSAQIYDHINLLTDSVTEFKFPSSPAPSWEDEKPLKSCHLPKECNDSASWTDAKIQTCESIRKPKLEPVSSSSFSQIISFGNSGKSDESLYAGGLNDIVQRSGEATYGHICESNKPALRRQNNYLTSTGSGRTERMITSFGQQDHVVAERMRREKLNQRFIALSALVPSLKKMDKASVLAGAAKYLKELQERVKALEEKTAQKEVEPVMSVKKSRLSFTDETSSTDESSETEQLSSDCSLPEIEARICGESVLIKIHCESSPGLAGNILVEVEKLKLAVVSSHTVPFGTHSTDITIVAKMEVGCSSAPKELVRSLRQAVLKAMQATITA